MAYVVTDGLLDEATLAEFVRSRYQMAARSLTVVTVGSLPPALDIADFGLRGPAVLDDNLVDEWQRTVDSTFGKGRLRVGVATATGNQGAIHVVDKVQPAARIDEAYSGRRYRSCEMSAELH
jgi:hypothetical protein